MSEQDNEQVTTLQRPTTDNREDWIAYWEQQGQPWRTEPEIDSERQKYLTERRAILSDTVKGVYPFRDIELNRADIEWLLATHENGRGPIDWDDLAQRKRRGLDLTRADLREVDLSELPLVNTQFFIAHPGGAQFQGAHLEGAKFGFSNLGQGNFRDAHLEGASLAYTHLEGAMLHRAHLEGTRLARAHLEGADLSGSYLNAETDLRDITLFNQEMGGVTLVDVHWGDVNLAVVDWSVLSLLGDESATLEARDRDDLGDTTALFLGFSKITARAYRQLATVLRSQGLTEDSARFAYRAQLMQRKVFWCQRKFGQYLFSLLVDLTTGYGYKAKRSLITYAVTISMFALIYFLLGPHLAWNEAIVVSMTAFHGRGFFPEQFKPGEPQALVAAIEAFVGLLIEVTFIATLTQRLFGK